MDGHQLQNQSRMSDNELGWMDDESTVLPPTPGRTLNIKTSPLGNSVSSKAKRRLDLGTDHQHGEQHSDLHRSTSIKKEKLKSGDERAISRRMKVQAWARILQHKQKLYIPHTSDPRSDEMGGRGSSVEDMDVKPIVNKENSSKAANVLLRGGGGGGTTTPVKFNDHDKIIKFMTTTPKLLSPLSE